MYYKCIYEEIMKKSMGTFLRMNCAANCLYDLKLQIEKESFFIYCDAE